MSQPRLLVSLAIWIALSPTVLAHDFWIEPSAFRPAAGELVQLALRVGVGFKGEPVARSPAKIDRFVVVSPSGETPVLGPDGGDPAGLVRLPSPGLFVVAYRSKKSSIALDPATFELYLAEEGLERISTERREKGESDRIGREIYSRCAKSLLLVEGAAAAGFDRPVGLTLEIVPEKSPYGLGAGRELPIRLLFHESPLEGALVVALNREAPEKQVSARTDAEGRVTLRLAREGLWLVKVVHMVRAPSDSGADWESLWASLTFEVPRDDAKPGSR